MKVTFKKDDVIVILGPRGSGKTSLMYYLIQSLKQYNFVILDVVGNLKGLENEKHVVGYFQVNPHDTNAVDETLIGIVKEGNVFLAIDEFDRYKYDKVLSDIVNLGRNYGIGLLLTARRSQDVHKDYIANANYTFLFRDLIPQDLQMLTKWFGIDQSVIRSLGQFEFLLFKGPEVVFRGKLPESAIPKMAQEQALNSMQQFPPAGDRNNPYAYSIPPAPGIDWNTEGIHDVV